MIRSAVRGALAAGLVLSAVGCSEEKAPAQKAPAGLELKGLGTPGSPGGGDAKGKAPGGKNATD